MPDMLTLYHHGSSACAAKVRLALAEKRLDWTGVYIDILAGEQFQPAYLAINPRAVVPALVHDGRVITESTLICEYLEESFPAHPLYPQSPYARFQVRTWTKAVDEELHPACSAITYVASHRHTILRRGAGSFEDFLKGGSSEGRAARELKWQWIQQGFEAPGVADKIRLYLSYLEKMEQALASGSWLVGDSFSMADVAMLPYLNRLSALAMDEVWEKGRLPRVEDWFRRVRTRPSFGPALLDWVPAGLQQEMLENGRRSLPDLRRLAGL